MQKLFTIIILALFSLAPEILCNNPANKTGTFETISDDFAFFLNDASSFFSSAGNIVVNNYEYIPVVIGLDFLSMNYIDPEIRKRIKKEDTNNFWNTVNEFGNHKYMFLGGVGLYSTGLLLRDKGLKEFGGKIFRGWFYSSILVSSCKLVIGRARPFNEKGSVCFFPFTTNNRYQSHPSGNAATVFAIATILSEETDYFIATIGLYGIVSVSAFARLKKDEHWFSDVALGCLIGTITGKYVCDEKFFGDISLFPTKNGIMLTYSF